jgi:isocitrate dehydrogenase (NAD+)
MGKSKRYKITLIPGDGVGPEIVNITRNIIDRLGVGIEWEEA